MASTRIPVLDFHGNGSVVCLEGIKPQATSHKLQASSSKRATNCRATIRPLTQAPSAKPQAPSAKLQAPSVKRYLNLGPRISNLCSFKSVVP